MEVPLKRTCIGAVPHHENAELQQVPSRENHSRAVLRVSACSQWHPSHYMTLPLTGATSRVQPS